MGEKRIKENIGKKIIYLYKLYNVSMHNKLFNICSIPYWNDIYELLNSKESNNCKIQIATSIKFSKNL